MGHFSDAWRLYRKALFITKRICGRENPELATIYHNLGGLEHACAKYARGEIFARRSVVLRKKAFGPDHPDVAADNAALAAILDAQGKRDEAEQLYVQDLAAFERVFGSESYEVAINLNAFAGSAATQLEIIHER